MDIISGNYQNERINLFIDLLLNRTSRDRKELLQKSFLKSDIFNILDEDEGLEVRSSLSNTQTKNGKEDDQQKDGQSENQKSESKRQKKSTENSERNSKTKTTKPSKGPNSKKLQEIRTDSRSSDGSRSSRRKLKKQDSQSSSDTVSSAKKNERGGKAKSSRQKANGRKVSEDQSKEILSIESKEETKGVSVKNWRKAKEKRTMFAKQDTAGTDSTTSRNSNSSADGKRRIRRTSITSRSIPQSDVVTMVSLVTASDTEQDDVKASKQSALPDNASKQNSQKESDQLEGIEDEMSAKRSRTKKKDRLPEKKRDSQSSGVNANAQKSSKGKPEAKSAPADLKKKTDVAKGIIITERMNGKTASVQNSGQKKKKRQKEIQLSSVDMSEIIEKNASLKVCCSDYPSYDIQPTPVVNKELVKCVPREMSPQRCQTPPYLQESVANNVPETAKECWAVYQRLADKGVIIPFTTLQRALMTPTELRLVSELEKSVG